MQLGPRGVDTNAALVSDTADVILALLTTAATAPVTTAEDRERVSLYYADAAALADLLADELTRLSIAVLPDYGTATAPGDGR